MTELDSRLRILNSILQMPHSKIEELTYLHLEAIDRDPVFYGHLATWYQDHGEVRDHKVLFVAHLLTSSLPAHRAAGWVLLRRLPPHLVAAAVDHAKREIGMMPRIFRHAVRTYLRDLEANTVRFDRAVGRSRQAIKHLYASLRIKPAARAQATLFDRNPPAESVLGQVKALAGMANPNEQAVRILEQRIPFTTAVGAIKAMTPAVLVALIGVMSPQEVINHLKMLSRYEAFSNPEVKELIAARLKEAETDTRVSSLKAMRALAAVDLDDETRTTLTEVTDARIARIATISRSTALFVDKSGSMHEAIALGKGIAALIGAITPQFTVLAFDNVALPVQAKGTDHSDWHLAFQDIHADGGTSIGAPLAQLTRDQIAVEQIIIVTDGGENAAPFFTAAYAEYQKRMGIAPTVILVGLGAYANRFARQLDEQGIIQVTWEFSGDYYSLPNLLPLLTMPTRAELVEQILAVELPRRPANNQEAQAS